MTCSNTEAGLRLKVSRELLDHAWMQLKGEERDWDPHMLIGLSPTGVAAFSLQEHCAIFAMCNLYSITTNQAAIIALFRVFNRQIATTARQMPWSRRSIPRPCR